MMKERGSVEATHIAACQLPRPLIASACAAVMVIRLCVSARFADNRASCAFSCVCEPRQ